MVAVKNRRSDRVPYFLYVSVMLWNGLCDDRLTETDSVDVFKGRLKTYFLSSVSLFLVLSSYTSLHYIACIYSRSVYIYFVS